MFLQYVHNVSYFILEDYTKKFLNDSLLYRLYPGIFFHRQNQADWTLRQYGLWTFQVGGTKLKIFFYKNHHPQSKLLNIEFLFNGIILQSNKKIWKLILSKNINNKKVLLNWYSSMKKNEKDSDNFWHRKLTLKVRNCPFSIAWFRAEVDLTKNLFYEKVLFFTQLTSHLMSSLLKKS